MTNAPVPPIISEQKFKAAPLAFTYVDGREVRQIGPYMFAEVLAPDGSCLGADFDAPARIYATQLRPHLKPVLASKPIRAIAGLEVRK